MEESIWRSTYQLFTPSPKLRVRCLLDWTKRFRPASCRIAASGEADLVRCARSRPPAHSCSAARCAVLMSAGRSAAWRMCSFPRRFHHLAFFRCSADRAARHGIIDIIDWVRFPARSIAVMVNKALAWACRARDPIALGDDSRSPNQDRSAPFVRGGEVHAGGPGDALWGVRVDGPASHPECGAATRYLGNRGSR